VNEVTFRDAADADSEALIALIGGVFEEYPGCVMDVDGEMPELRAIASHFRRLGGRFWVAEQGGMIVGCIGSAPLPDRGVQLHKLYVRADARRRGIGGALCDRLEDTARQSGATRVELWSDTRFKTAHSIYERRGYVRGSQTRELHDKSDTVEYFFRKPLIMSPEELERIARRLQEFPSTVRKIVAGIAEDVLRWRKPGDEFSILENVCHLRDIEREGYTLRLRKLLDEAEPFLPDIDGVRVAAERDYNSQPIQSALEDFAIARMGNVAVVCGIQPDQLGRAGFLETVGPITVERLLSVMQNHDREHLQLIEDLRDARTPKRG
jgi:putative acetyltransferase